MREILVNMQHYWRQLAFSGLHKGNIINKLALIETPLGIANFYIETF